jgi:hypothetical protein
MFRLSLSLISSSRKLSTLREVVDARTVDGLGILADTHFAMRSCLFSC